MAYLGIRETEDTVDNGLYYFGVLSVRDEIAQYFTNPSFYVDREKEVALNDFGCTEEEIKDAGPLIRKWRKNAKEISKENKFEKAYLGIRGTPYDGVYEFNYAKVRDKVAKKFDNTYLTMDKSAILTEFKTDESQIKDGGFLMSGNVMDYLKGNKEKNKATSKVSESVDKGNMEIANKNLLRNMINCVAEDSDVIEITMLTGEVYCVALRDIFYLHNGVSLENCARMASDNIVSVNESTVDKLIDKGDIIHISRSKISYNDGFAVITNFDDVYSPTVLTDEVGKITINHYISRKVINVNAVVSVSGVDTYRDIAIDFTKLSNKKQKIVYEYLTKKFGKSKK